MRNLYKFVFIGLITTSLIGCSPRNAKESVANIDPTSKTSSNADGIIYTERKESNTERKERVKKEGGDTGANIPSTYIPPEPNEKPVEEKVAEEIQIETFKVESSGIEKREGEEGLEANQSILIDTLYSTTDAYHGGENMMTVHYFGNEPVEAFLQSYNYSSVIIDESGESLVFTPIQWGGTFTVQALSYDYENARYNVGETLFSQKLMENDAVLMQSYLPEGPSNYIVTYEYPGEYIAQFLPVYNGQSGFVSSALGYDIKINP